jgi:pimeloyl-ACP methyl ester carboxylesterase
MERVRTPTLEIAYEQAGPMDGDPVVLLHGFPYDPRAYDEVVPGLVAAGCRVVVPYLRGYGPTRFLSASTPRSGQQAALAKDLLDLLDALHLQRATLVGYDWGGRAACIVAALWPERVQGLVTVGGYNLQNIPASVEPAQPAQEHRLWYQYYFHTERGRAGLTKNRFDFCRLLWQLWSPGWQFDDATYARSAASFDNPDFVDVVIHSYRHRYAYVAGDPELEPIEVQLRSQPPIGVPSMILSGGNDGVTPSRSADGPVRGFNGPCTRRVVPGAGHNLPQEKPEAVVEATLELLGRHAHVS